jgi:hypothetical protein
MVALFERGSQVLTEIYMDVTDSKAPLAIDVANALRRSRMWIRQRMVALFERGSQVY